MDRLSGSNSSNRFSVSFSGKTDVGRIRELNEDCMTNFEAQGGYFFVVCDGMGGHNSGEIASRLAVDSIEAFFENIGSGVEAGKLLAKAIEVANKAILSKSVEDTGYKGMGTTCVILYLKNHRAYYACVGDSRIYIVRSGKIYQLTKDQSFVQSLVDSGYLTYEEAESHPRKNELLQALGVKDSVIPQINENGLRVFRNDKFILCSDGLSGAVTDQQINAIVDYHDSVTSAELLINAANENGGHDNITVQVIHIAGGHDLPEGMKYNQPEGSLDKKIRKPVTEIIDGTNDRTVKVESGKKSGKTGLVLFLLLTLILIPLFYWLVFKERNIQNFNHQELVETKNQERNLDSIRLTSFLNSIYNKRGLDSNEIMQEKIDSRNVKYLGKDKKTAVLNYSGLVSTAKKFDLKFKMYESPDHFIVFDNRMEDRRYSIKFEKANDTIKIREINFVEIVSKKDVGKDSVKTTKESETDNRRKQDEKNDLKDSIETMVQTTTQKLNSDSNVNKDTLPDIHNKEYK